MKTHDLKKTAMAVLIEDRVLDKLVELAINALRLYWRRKGHELTGNFIKKIEPILRKRFRSTDIDFFMPVYGPIRNVGIRPERVPYTRGSGRRRSKFIQGLTKYAMLRLGASRKMAERIAHAIATKRKKTGFPGSGWLDEALEAMDPFITDILQLSVDETLRALINQTVKQRA